MLCGIKINYYGQKNRWYILECKCKLDSKSTTDIVSIVQDRICMIQSERGFAYSVVCLRSCIQNRNQISIQKMKQQSQALLYKTKYWVIRRYMAPVNNFVPATYISVIFVFFVELFNIFILKWYTESFSFTSIFYCKELYIVLNSTNIFYVCAKLTRSVTLNVMVYQVKTFYLINISL